MTTPALGNIHINSGCSQSAVVKNGLHLPTDINFLLSDIFEGFASLPNK